MLVLSRKKNESIVIRDDITVTIVDIRGEQVRLGITAPREVPVHRREVLDRQIEAAKMSQINRQDDDQLPETD